MTAKIKVEIDFFMARNHRHATVSRDAESSEHSAGKPQSRAVLRRLRVAANPRLPGAGGHVAAGRHYGRQHAAAAGKPENGPLLAGPVGSGKGALAGGALGLFPLLPFPGSGGGAE